MLKPNIGYLEKFSIKGHHPFDDVEIEFKNEEQSIHQWTILFGENNTGKTTLLRYIAGLQLQLEKSVDNDSEYNFVPLEYTSKIPKKVWEKESDQEIILKIVLLKEAS